jgi:cysteine sulfinate desulfinase/cysteine desulfurase-like protein
MCTIVGHKIGAPKGVAALYVKEGAPFQKLLHGYGWVPLFTARNFAASHVIFVAAFKTPSM